MIVYVDRARSINTRQAIADLEEQSHNLIREKCVKHSDSALSLLIASGELWQGLLDEQFERLGYDEFTPVAEHCARLGVEAAGLAEDGSSPERLAAFQSELNWLQHASLPLEVTLNTPEGYAFYAVYPQLYELAARSLNCRESETTIIGLRSIGTSLSAVVARATGAMRLPITLRPTGHPFARKLQLGPEIERRVLQNRRDQFLIVDEGPGLSGSSFLCVASWLIERGVKEEQIVFFPSRAGEPGNQCTPEGRSLWKRIRKCTVDFAAIEPKICAALLPETTSAAEPGFWQDYSAGQWRTLIKIDQQQWPPALVQQERRKFLFAKSSPTYLAKFAGLGKYGQAAYQRGVTLTAAGLIPPVVDLRGGFLIQQWMTDARPLLDLASLTQHDRGALIEAVVKYLNFEAEHFPAASAGADSTELWKMATFNIAQRFGNRYDELLAELGQCAKRGAARSGG